MLMLPEFRQRAIQLAAIPLEHREMIRLISVAEDDSSLAKLDEIDHQVGVAKFITHHVKGDPKGCGFPLYLPLNAIKHVWRDQEGGFVISFVGALVYERNGYQYRSR